MPNRISLEELAALPTVAGLQVSPDGEQVAYYADFTGRFELYVMHLSTGEGRQVTSGQAPKALRAGFVWRRDGKHIYFSKDSNGDERQALHELHVPSGEVRALQHDPQSMDYPADTQPGGRLVLVNSTRGGQLNVHAYDPAREGQDAWTALTSLPNTTTAAGYSPDGKQIALTSNESADLRNTDGYLMNADGSGLKRVFRAKEGSRDSLGKWHPDGQRLAVSSDEGGHGRVGILNVQSGEVQWLTSPDERLEEQPGEFSPDGRYLSVIRNTESTMQPLLYDVQTGTARELKVPAGMVYGTQFVHGGRGLLMQHTSTTSRPEVLLYDLHSDTYKVLLPARYGQIDPALFVTGEYMHYPTTDGLQVPALLYTPRDRQPGRKYPALVHAHGGPTAQFFRGFDPQAQFLADRGYYVLCPNFRGSTGYGVAWRDANLLDWGGRDLQDIVAGAEYLKTLPDVDPARLGIFGGSYGGYLSYLAAVKHPELFKVSVPIVGITDLHKLFEDNSRVMPQLGYYFKTMMGDPVANHALWRDRSAITHAANLKAHMFMMHGTNDPRCPINQARDFRDELLRLGRQEGRDFEYIEFGDEGHGAGDIAGKTRSYTLMADYLQRRL